MTRAMHCVVGHRGMIKLHYNVKGPCEYKYVSRQTAALSQLTLGQGDCESLAAPNQLCRCCNDSVTRCNVIR